MACQNNWPEDAEYNYGDAVEKFTGEAQWHGQIVSAYHTIEGKLRYVVQVWPQKFQMIAVPSQLRKADWLSTIMDTNNLVTAESVEVRIKAAKYDSLFENKKD